MRAKLHIPSPKKDSAIRNVAVFGSADIDEDHPVYRQAYDVAKYLASRDKVIVNGGGPGVMQAATQGAKAAGGQTLVVTFSPDPDEAPEFEGRFDGNKADVEIKTKNYVERMFGLMEHADIFIIFKGGTGTLSEWATAWLMAHIYYGNHKPLILFGHFWKEVMECVEKNFFIGKHEMEVFKIVETEKELIPAFEYFEAILEKRRLEKQQKKDEPQNLRI